MAFRLADYRMADGPPLAIADHDVLDRPGLMLDQRDDEGPVWLSIERLARRDAPLPPPRLMPWLVVSPDPAIPPTVLPERPHGVTATERQALLAIERAAEEDFTALAPLDGAGEPTHYDLTLRLSDAPEMAEEIAEWIAADWRAWSMAEAARRKTIGLYGRLYKLQQQLELGGAESAVEAVWGIGPVSWTRDGRTIERPFIERLVELELESTGTIRVRPRAVDARVDLKPYEAFDCPNLITLEQTIDREITRTGEDEGVVPFRPDTFAPILIEAATRLASNGRYGPPHAIVPETGGLRISDGWVLFARPRSQHVVLDDIGRFRTLVRYGTTIKGLAERLVTPPSDQPHGPWTPLGDKLGGDLGLDQSVSAEAPLTDAFFPKPFNDDQIAIVRRLAKSDGLVVQGPPGTGKTHTIANLICHAMALGQSVLVVSRGEAALSVLRDQLPDKVRPLTIALLASERQGMRQVETAIREIQSAVEESRPEIRLSAIRRCEAEIVKIRNRVAAIDVELDAIAQRQMAPIGPAAEQPADLARRLAASREAHAWFEDRPSAFVEDCGITDDDMAALAEARRAAADSLDHRDARLPPRQALPTLDAVLGWHDDLTRARSLKAGLGGGLWPGFSLRAEQLIDADRCVRALRDLALAWETALRHPWLEVFLTAAARGDASPWLDILRDIAAASDAVDAERARLAPFAVEVPADLMGDEAARAAISRAASGERAWGRLSIGKALSKERVAAVRVRGLPPAEDKDLWKAVEAHLDLQAQRLALEARWRTFAMEVGAPAGTEAGGAGPAVSVLAQLERTRQALTPFAGGRDHPALDALATDPSLARNLAARMEAAALLTRLATAEDLLRAASAQFSDGCRTAVMGRQFLEHLIGRDYVEPSTLETLWIGLLERIDDIHAKAPAFATIRLVCDRLAAAGAPLWAARLGRESPDDSGDPLIPETWRNAWDHGASAFHLDEIDGRDRMLGLGRERDALDRRSRKLFVELVRERAFHTLERRLSPRVKSALVEYVRALGRLGKGSGKGAGRHRRAARDAMARCYEAIPCWIMPSWRVAELLPSGFATFDLVILDEASQSDVTELPALLRGRKILAVGDDRQVSPTPPFVTLGKIEQLRRRYLTDLPFSTLLEPGESLYDLMRAVYPDSRLMLKEHFRCVEPIIRFSMQFYPEKLIALRIPSAEERLDPPLVDIYVPHGVRDGARKINRAEAQVIVDEIAGLVADPARSTRTIGVISLIGGEQAELVRVMLSERIGDEAMQRHAILCGDSATFQGNERDIVFLSLVADKHRRSTLTMLRYEQRFNVAVSRARDRLVLVRSVDADTLNPKDLKARLIAHFHDPLPARAAVSNDPESLCESGFERDVMRALIACGYRVEPQVGAEGFRIDLVVEGVEGRRLAVECDGDSFHGPERWREDMRRQRILERVGWRFWRCFASNFYADPEGTLTDLVATLEALKIEPLALKGFRPAKPLTEYRVIAAPPLPPGTMAPHDAAPPTLRAGDRIELVFGDRKRRILCLTESDHDDARGLVGMETPLGLILLRAEEGDEIDVPQASGPPVKALVETVTRVMG